MSLKTIFLLPILILLGTGCHQYPISGFITVDADSERRPVVYLVDPVNYSSLVSSYEGKVIDSAHIEDHGLFRFVNPPLPDEEKMFLLTIQNPGETYFNKLENEHPDTANYIPFIYKPGGHVIIQADSKSMIDGVILGGTLSVNTEVTQLIRKRSELYYKYLGKFKEVDEENLMEYEKAEYDFKNKMLQSVSDSKNLFLHALALRWCAIDGDYERIPELIKQECQTLTEIDSEHPWTNQICQITHKLPLSPGDIIPDDDLPMANGDTTQLYKLLGEKLTILDLWASWCVPCRKENRQTLVPLWDKYGDKGLQIIGYALDSSESGWKRAIEKDGADRWLHASHLQGDVSPFLDRLNITTIPANYIIDNQGKILAKNLHDVELENWVKKHMKSAE